MKRSMVAIFLLAASSLCNSQNIIMFGESDFPGMTILKTETFAGEALYGYIDGGADLYLEYGFRQLSVTDLVAQDNRLKFEVYIMEDPPAAFGIYSLAIANCRQFSKYATFSCITPYQVAAASGPLFINALNPRGSPAGQEACEQMVKLFLEKNPQAPWYVPAFAQSPKVTPFINSLRYFEGPVALTNALPAWYDLFNDLPFMMYTVQITGPSGTGILARIEFPTVSARDRFLMVSGVNALDQSGTPAMTGGGLYRSWYRINDTRILFFESVSDVPFIKQIVPEMPSTVPDHRY